VDVIAAFLGDHESRGPHHAKMLRDGRRGDTQAIGKSIDAQGATSQKLEDADPGIHGKGLEDFCGLSGNRHGTASN